MPPVLGTLTNDRLACPSWLLYRLSFWLLSDNPEISSALRRIREMKLFNKKDDSWFLSLELGPTKLVVVRLSDAGFSFQLMQVSVFS